jgi:hypothetical protein
MHFEEIDSSSIDQGEVVGLCTTLSQFPLKTLEQKSGKEGLGKILFNKEAKGVKTLIFRFLSAIYPTRFSKSKLSIKRVKIAENRLLSFNYKGFI